MQTMNFHRSLLSVTLAVIGIVPPHADNQKKSGQPAVAAAERRSLPVQRSLVAKDTLFPVSLRLQDGWIAAVVRSPANHLGLDARLDIVFSSDEGKTRSKSTLVADILMNDRDPAFGQA